MKDYFFLLFLFLLLIYSETSKAQVGLQLSQIPPLQEYFNPVRFSASPLFLASEILNDKLELLDKQRVRGMNEMPKAWTYEHLAFFCKVEVQLEKSAKLPVKFRLGTVNYVDGLEGKR